MITYICQKKREICQNFVENYLLLLKTEIQNIKGLNLWKRFITTILNILTLPVPILDEEKKLFIFTLLVVPQKDLWRSSRPSENLLRHHKEVWK